ncbi:amino acid ABC transporter permease [Rubrimonas cliftonensis]|uniref:Amino acid ABC transporter membrane protein 1, PAAT family n=1 Tax=Rubrimonas cliftonensis TaxID=89524 RepID=A0A1H4DIK9_9RHOB|nr:amino acid ABC transporter permease [Rubrimonas cliftonensis]SEA72289.1 amino acid ABC transporter membrane protein 1, PAAT family [Rubrimonas cliftonensis]
MDWLADAARSLNEATGITLTYLYDGYDGGRFLEGIVNTVLLSLACLSASLVIGVVGAFARGAKSAAVRWLVGGYTELFRNTPPLVQMYFLFFGVGALLPTVQNRWGFEEPMLGAWAWAIISLSFFAGAFNVEIFRSGIEAVPRATVEAAESLGYTRLQIYLHVVLPLAFRVCLPALNNNLVNLVKTTTLAYAIAVPELLYMSNQIWSDSLNVPEMMVTLLLLYVGLVGVLVWAMHRWEQAMRIPGFGRSAA